MHKKDINDRFRSLAFKMEKVYNLNKKKGPGHEVYKFFKEVVIDDPLLEWKLYKNKPGQKYEIK